jgi:hypothetical protein
LFKFLREALVLAWSGEMGAPNLTQVRFIRQENFAEGSLFRAALDALPEM